MAERRARCQMSVYGKFSRQNDVIVTRRVVFAILKINICTLQFCRINDAENRSAKFPALATRTFPGRVTMTTETSINTCA